jgi:hypothetical protein
VPLQGLQPTLALGPLAFGPWPLALGPWPLALCPWPLALGPWPLAPGPRPLALGPLAFGPWPLQGYGGLHSLKNLFLRSVIFQTVAGRLYAYTQAVRLRTALDVAVALLQLLLSQLQLLQLPWLLLLFPLVVAKKLLEQTPAVAVRSNQSPA